MLRNKRICPYCRKIFTSYDKRIKTLGIPLVECPRCHELVIDKSVKEYICMTDNQRINYLAFRQTKPQFLFAILFAFCGLISIIYGFIGYINKPPFFVFLIVGLALCGFSAFVIIRIFKAKELYESGVIDDNLIISSLLRTLDEEYFTILRESGYTYNKIDFSKYYDKETGLTVSEIIEKQGINIDFYNNYY